MPIPPNSARAIFDQAIEISSPDERQALLEQACAGDSELRQRVEGLLRAFAEAGSFLESPPPGATEIIAHAARGEAVGTVIAARYKLLEQIGEGGMGTVWMAQQTEPVKRPVAVKLIKAGMDSAQVIARFEAERQALALMDHPHIAKVHDAGTTDEGRPFFVMEVVKGVPITTYCDEHRLTPRTRLQLFISVCHAIQHAHQKGIIHRDLKPSNVLVALSDDRPVPKVIDFGVAKATGQQLTEESLQTGFGAVVGTLEYMSPEQASFNQLDVDTRSDVYSLGVLLYELLTGSPPFRKKELEKAGMLEMLRVIREQEPSKPSTKLGTADGLPTLATNRGTEPAKLTKLVRGELDWIVMKALEKDRNRRYETVNALAMDVQRYLADEPVLACPPSRLYRFRKFSLRHRAPMVAGGAAALAALLAIVALTISTTLIAREKREKEAALEQATANLETAVDAVDRMLTRVGETRLADVPYLEKVRRDLLIDALEFFQEFSRQNANNPSLRRELARCWDRVAKIHNLLGEHEQAKAALRQSLDLWQRLSDDNPDRAEFRQEVAGSRYLLGTTLIAAGRRNEADAELQFALAAYQDLLAETPGCERSRRGLAGANAALGMERRKNGSLLEAETHLMRAIEIWNELVADFPDNAEYMLRMAREKTNLAPTLSDLGRHQQARDMVEQAIAVQTQLVAKSPRDFDRREDLAGSYLNLGNLMGHDPVAREKLLNQAREQWEELLGEFRHVPRFREQLAGTLINLGLMHKGSKKLPQAVEVCRQAIIQFARLAEDHPGVLSYRRSLAGRYSELGHLFVLSKELQPAEEAVRQSVAVFDKLVADSPKNVEFQDRLAAALSNLGSIQQDRGRLTEAAESLNRGVDLRARLLDEFPNDERHHSGLGAALNNLSQVFLKQKQWTESRKALEKAIEHQTVAFEADPGNPTFRRYLRNHYLNLAEALKGLGETELARKATQQAARLKEGAPLAKQ